MIAILESFMRKIEKTFYSHTLNVEEALNCIWSHVQEISSFLTFSDWRRFFFVPFFNFTMLFHISSMSFSRFSSLYVFWCSIQKFFLLFCITLREAMGCSSHTVVVGLVVARKKSRNYLNSLSFCWGSWKWSFDYQLRCSLKCCGMKKYLVFGKCSLGCFFLQCESWSLHLKEDAVPLLISIKEE